MQPGDKCALFVAVREGLAAREGPAVREGLQTGVGGGVSSALLHAHISRLIITVCCCCWDQFAFNPVFPGPKRIEAPPHRLLLTSQHQPAAERFHRVTSFCPPGGASVPRPVR